jgi:thiol-disulfide isomerase/thioredoxin
MKIGPFVLPYTALLFAIVTILGLSIARYLDRRRPQQVEQAVTRIFIVAVLAARLVFILRYRTAYLDHPLSMLDIRDGGWDAQAGVIAAWGYAWWRMHRDRAMRRPLLLSIGGASAAWIIGSVALLAATSMQGSLPVRTLQDIGGRQVAFASFNGKPTVVNFWATWCPPCRKEMPAMALVQQARPDVNLVFVNQGESIGEVRQFLAAGKLDLKNVLLDPSHALARDYAVDGYPTSLFFDASGKLVSQHTGSLSAASLTHQLEQAGAR